MSQAPAEVHVHELPSEAASAAAESWPAMPSGARAASSADESTGPAGLLDVEHAVIRQPRANGETFTAVQS